MRNHPPIRSPGTHRPSTPYSLFPIPCTQRSDPRLRLLRLRTPRILLHQQRIPLPCRRRIMQIVLIDLPLRQQRPYPQRAPRILRPQKLILPHRVLQCLRIMERSSLLRQQLRHRIHAIRSMNVRRLPMVDRPKPIHRSRIVGPRPRPLRNRLQRLQPLLRLLPRRQLHLALRRRLCRKLLHGAAQHHRAAQHCRAIPTPPRIADFSTQAHVSSQNSTDSPSLRDPTPRQRAKTNPVHPPTPPLNYCVWLAPNLPSEERKSIHQANLAGYSIGAPPCRPAVFHLTVRRCWKLL